MRVDRIGILFVVRGEKSFPQKFPTTQISSIGFIFADFFLVHTSELKVLVIMRRACF